MESSDYQWDNYTELAHLARARGDLPRAERLLRLAREEVDLLKKPTCKLASNLLVQARNSAQNGAYKQAARLFKRAISLYRGALGPKHLRVGVAMKLLAEMYQEQKHHLLAETQYHAAVSIYEELLGSNAG